MYRTLYACTLYSLEEGKNWFSTIDFFCSFPYSTAGGRLFPVNYIDFHRYHCTHTYYYYYDIDNTVVKRILWRDLLSRFSMDNPALSPRVAINRFYTYRTRQQQFSYRSSSHSTVYFLISYSATYLYVRFHNFIVLVYSSFIDR